MINENHFEVSLDRPWLATCQHGWNCGQFLRLPLRRLGTGNEYAVKVRDNLCHCHSALHVFCCNLKSWSVSTCTGRACAAPFLCTCFIYRNFKIQTFNVKISKLMARLSLALPQKIRSCWSCWFHQKWCNSHNHSHESQEFTRPTSFEIFLCRLVQVVNTKAISLRERTVASLRFADSIWRFEDWGSVFWFSADIFRMVRREIGVMRECQTQKLKRYFWMWGADIGSTYAMGKRNTETLPLVRCIIWCIWLLFTLDLGFAIVAPMWWAVIQAKASSSAHREFKRGLFSMPQLQSLGLSFFLLFLVWLQYDYWRSWWLGLAP